MNGVNIVSVAQHALHPPARVQGVFHHVGRGELGPRVSACAAFAFDSLKR